MNLTTALTLLSRYGHVLSTGVWLGGYVALAVVVAPVMVRRGSGGRQDALGTIDPLSRVAMSLV